MRQDTSLKDADIFSATIFGKLETKTALANSSLTDDTNNTTITLHCIFEFKRESGKLVVPAGKRDSTVFRFETLRLREHVEVP